MISEPQDFSKEVLLTKYARNGETKPTDIRVRVAKALANNPAEESDFFQTMERGFIPAGRVNASAGMDVVATMINCFVQPVGDSITGTEMVNGEEYPGIYPALTQSAETLRRGGGVGYDFSQIRPRNSVVKGTNSRASGPVSYMSVFHASCTTVESAGQRRGAQMGVLRCDHPDIEEFVMAKAQGGLFSFNISVAVTDKFMKAVEEDDVFELVHKAAPNKEYFPDAYKIEGGNWCYKVIKARQLWDLIMNNTYNAAEPGVLFIDKINLDNNLGYIEVLEATNPCGEQPLPKYGCCCLGSINLTSFVINPFDGDSQFDWDEFESVVAGGVRILDRVLDKTVWPLPEQKAEAENKRRIGLGYTGLGSMLLMMGLDYDSSEGREFAAKLTERMRNAAYLESTRLAKEQGAFPMFDADEYLKSPRFASRLPDHIKQEIRKNGIRNSHLISIAPTGTISIAFTDNVSGGIEPVFSLMYKRKKVEADGSRSVSEVQDYAYRLYKSMGRDPEVLVKTATTALNMSAQSHMMMVAAVAPYVDAAISKTVNVPEDYPFEDFKNLYMDAWHAGLKGITTYRPNATTGSVLSVDEPKKEEVKEQSASSELPNDIQSGDAERAIRITDIPAPALQSLRWPNRPATPGGNESWTYFVDSDQGDFSVTVGHINNGRAHPFEVWVAGNEQPRVLGALAKILSVDMRTDDPSWLALKLDSLSKTVDHNEVKLQFNPNESAVIAPSVVSAFAKVISYRLDQLDVSDLQGQKPMVNAMFAKKEPKTGTNGSMSWSVDVVNPATGDDIHMIVKEAIMPDGSRRPFSVWFAGNMPSAMDGLAKCLSIDMRIVDPSWIGLKLRKLLNFGEQRGDFLAFVPGEQRQQNYPSTVAYVAALLIHRYQMLGILDGEGYPLAKPFLFEEANSSDKPSHVVSGKVCGECGQASVIKRDGCEFCTSCGHVGACG